MNQASPPSWSADGQADWLDALLRATPAAPLPDDGFTARVMHRLPASLSAAQMRKELQRGKRQSWRFTWFSLIGAVLGGIIAFFGSHWPSPEETSASLTALLQFRPLAAQALTPWLASLFSAAVLAYVMSRET